MGKTFFFSRKKKKVFPKPYSKKKTDVGENENI
jgi:hypothetical protein